MGRVRVRFDEEFKRKVAPPAESGAVSVTQVARDLGINVETLRKLAKKSKGIVL